MSENLVTPLGFSLAVCAELVFTELPMTERVRRIDAAGFDVELWDWSRHDLAALAATGARFSSMTGYRRGTLTGAGRAELLATAAESIAAGRQLGVARLNLHGTGLDPDGMPVVPATEVTGPMWVEAVATLTELAEMGADAGVTFCLENLNTRLDHPGVPFARAADTMALVAAVDHPNLRMMLDLYHAQIGEGDLITLTATAGDLVSEIQVADVPGRCEPGTGEINYPAIARALNAQGYQGMIGLEAHPSGASAAALAAFRAAFS